MERPPKRTSLLQQNQLARKSEIVDHALIHKPVPEAPQILDKVDETIKKKRFVPKEESRALKLRPYEELFFHYLSILAIIPKERPKVLVILDTFGTRPGAQAAEEAEPTSGDNRRRQTNKSTFTMMQSEAQRKLTDYKTLVDIPEKSKLLRANTLMLELYVQIHEDMKELLEYMNIAAHPTLD